MRICRWGMLLLCCLLMTGCTSTMLNREYRVVELHSSKFWESDSADILRAESYQDIVNDLLVLVGEYQQQATIRLYTDDNEATVAAELERAATEVQKDTPLGAYAVQYITTTNLSERGYYEITVRIGYSRSREQMKAIVNATSVTALESLLSAAMESGRKELAVRLGYWNEGDDVLVDEAVERVEEKWELTNQLWVTRYYPSSGNAGLIEFRLEPAPMKPPVSTEPEKTEEPQMPQEPGKTEEGQEPVQQEPPAQGEPLAEPEKPAEGGDPSAEGTEVPSDSAVSDDAEEKIKNSEKTEKFS